MKSGTAKTRRFEGRIDPESDQVIAQAAALTGQSKAAFMVQAARAEATMVLGRADVTPMDAEQFDALVAALDRAEPVPEALRRAAASPHRVVQR